MLTNLTLHSLINSNNNTCSCMDNSFMCARRLSNRSSSSVSDSSSINFEDTLVNMESNSTRSKTAAGKSQEAGAFAAAPSNNDVTMEAVDQFNASQNQKQKTIAASKSNQKKMVRFDKSVLMPQGTSSSNDAVIQTAKALSAADRMEIQRNRRQQRRNELDLYLRVRVLLGILEKRNPKLRQQVLQAVRLHNHKFQNGSVARTSLPETIESTLRLMAGEDNWRLACDIQRRIERHNRRTVSKPSSNKGCGGAA